MSLSRCGAWASSHFAPERRIAQGSLRPCCLRQACLDLVQPPPRARGQPHKFTGLYPSGPTPTGMPYDPAKIRVEAFKGASEVLAEADVPPSPSIR